MTSKLTRRERCAIGRHTPRSTGEDRGDAVRHACCRYCGAPIMRTEATRIWFRAGMLA